MELWVPITIAAAFSQNLRFMLQRHLAATGLSTGGATFARFVFAAPLAAALLAVLLEVWEETLPTAGVRFWAFAIAGGVAQICATMLVVALFSLRSFAVGVVFKKTEVIQTALLGLVVLGERVSATGLLAIAVGVAGVLILSDPPEGGAGWRRFANRAAIYGLAAGALFGVSAIGYRGASLALDGHFLLRSVTTLMWVTVFQSVAMALWLGWREPGEVTRVLRNWKVTALVGLTGMIGSLGWFTAFTLQNAAYVKALGQIELVFSFLASWLVFREKTTTRELLGTACVVVSIVLLVLAI
ncbi:MAG: DMT family transporter [Pseudomonadota bacterium]